MVQNSSSSIPIVHHKEEPFHPRERRANIVNVLCRCIPNCYRSRGRRQVDGFQTEIIPSRGGQTRQIASWLFLSALQVMNVSETGVRIQTRLFVKNGDVLQLSIELDGGRQLGCEIQALNVGSRQFGAKILSISPDDRERLSHILDDHMQNRFLLG